MNSITQIIFVILTVSLGRLVFQSMKEQHDWKKFLKFSLINIILSSILGITYVVELGSSYTILQVAQEGLIFFTIWQIGIIGITAYTTSIKNKKKSS